MYQGVRGVYQERCEGSVSRCEGSVGLERREVCGRCIIIIIFLSAL